MISRTATASACWGLHLMEKLNARECKARTMFIFNGFIGHWKDHVRTTLAPLLEAYQVGLETGDLEYAGFSAMALLLSLILCRGTTGKA